MGHSFRFRYFVISILELCPGISTFLISFRMPGIREQRVVKMVNQSLIELTGMSAGYGRKDIGSQ